MCLPMFTERCFSGIVHNLLETSPARGFIIFRWLGECIVHFLRQTLRVAGVSQFVCYKCPSYPGIWWWWSLSYSHVKSGDAPKWSCVHPSVWTWCWSLSDWTQCIVPIEARSWNYISRSHTCPRLRATCHFLFLSLHWSLLSARTCRYWGCFWMYPLVDCKMSPCSPWGSSLWERQAICTIPQQYISPVFSHHTPFSFLCTVD